MTKMDELKVGFELVGLENVKSYLNGGNIAVDAARASEPKLVEKIETALEGERYAVNGREIYAHLPHGVAESLLTKGFLDKKLKIVFTGRNWRTALTLADL